MERATVSCKPSLVMVRERELSTGGTILVSIPGGFTPLFRRLETIVPI